MKDYNDSYNYVLTCIDILRKYVHAVPIYDKTARTVATALEKMFKTCGDRLPHVVQRDKRLEFRGAEMQKILKKYGIIFRETKNDVKASCKERFLRTMKGHMWRYFTQNHTNRYVDVLDQIIQSYNTTVHSTTCNSWQNQCCLKRT